MVSSIMGSMLANEPRPGCAAPVLLASAMQWSAKLAAHSPEENVYTTTQVTQEHRNDVKPPTTQSAAMNNIYKSLGKVVTDVLVTSMNH